MVIITKSLRVVNLAEDGVNIPFYNIIYIWSQNSTCKNF